MATNQDSPSFALADDKIVLQNWTGYALAAMARLNPGMRLLACFICGQELELVFISWSDAEEFIEDEDVQDYVSTLLKCSSDLSM